MVAVEVDGQPDKLDGAVVGAGQPVSVVLEELGEECGAMDGGWHVEWHEWIS